MSFEGSPARARDAFSGVARDVLTAVPGGHAVQVGPRTCVEGRDLGLNIKSLWCMSYDILVLGFRVKSSAFRVQG